MIDDQTAAFHMKDIHACARLVDEDERVAVLHVEAHLVGDDAAQRVEDLAHVRRMRIQEEPVGVRQAEHPLSPLSLSAGRASVRRPLQTGGQSRRWERRFRRLDEPFSSCPSLVRW